MSKRKRVVLTFQQKIEILKQLNDGKKGAILAREYGIGTSTISDIKRNGDTILKFVSNLESENQISEKKTRKTAHNTDLDSLMYRWYLKEKQNGGVPLDAAICAKALEINSQLTNGKEGFKASNGWLRHFKNRHGIKEIKEVTEEPSKQFRNFLKRGGYTHENIYNVADTTLLWNSLPNCDNKNTTSVKIVSCTNVNSSHKLPLCVLGSDKMGEINDTIYYRHQQNPETAFEEWFEDVFVPRVTQRQENTGNVGKILLVMNDSSWHPPKDTLIKDRDNFEIFLVPETFTQPMEVVMNRFIFFYRKNLLELLLSKSCPVKQFLEKFTLAESISVIGKAWDSIPRTDIVQSWTRLLSDLRNETDLNHDGILEILEIAQKIKGFEEINSVDITQWFESDKYFSFYTSTQIEHLNYDESHECGEPSHIEAYQSLETAISWFRTQNECNNLQLSVLENLRDLAASKLCGKIKQES